MTTVERKDGVLKLKHPEERARLQRSFSPRSHGTEPRPDAPHVLICTDADSVGVNLQDASLVVNYDLPAGADDLIQRLGRVLRASPQPGRALTVLTFVPRLALNETESGVAKAVAARYRRLRRRQNTSKQILGAGVLPPGDALDAVLSLETPVDIAAALTAEDSDRVVPMARHLETLAAHREAAQTLVGRSFHTSRMTAGKTRLVVVFRVSGRVHTIVANPKAKVNRDMLVSESEIDALGLLACEPGTPRAAALGAPPERIVRATERVIRLWCRREGVRVTDAERVTSVYLVHGDPSLPPRVV